MRAALPLQAALLVVLLLAGAARGEVRFASLSWSKPVGSTVVEFRLTLGLQNEPAQAVGTLYPLPSPFDAGDGDLFMLSPVVTSQADHPVYGTIFFAELTFEHRYPVPGVYNASYSACCRSAGLNNNANQAWAVATRVDATVESWNSAPYAAVLPPVAVYAAAGVPGTSSFQLAAVDVNNQSLAWRLATPAEMGSRNATQPLGLSVGAQGTVTWTNPGLLAFGLYSAQFIVSDFYTSVAVDVLLDLRATPRFCQSSCTNAGAACTADSGCAGPCAGPTKCVANAMPAFTWPTPANNQLLVGDPCAPFNVRVVAEDSDPADNVTVVTGPLPPGIRVVKAVGTARRYVKYRWDADLADDGLYTWCTTAWDSRGGSAGLRCFHIQIYGKPCSGRGTCVQQQCQCQGQWTGTSCHVCRAGWFGSRCSQKYGGPVYAFGDNSRGETGQPLNSSRVLVPTEVTLGGTAGLSFVRIAAGRSHSVAVTDDGRLFTFGDNAAGQLGCGPDGLNRTVAYSAVPLEITRFFGWGTLFFNTIAVAAGNAHSVALTRGFRPVPGRPADADIPTYAQGNRVFVWGSNQFGQLGRNESWGSGFQQWGSDVPVDITHVFDEEVQLIAARGDYTYALTNSSRVLAWGRNTYGQLATNDTVDRHLPTDVTRAFPEPVVDLALGDNHVLALGASGTVYAVGSNLRGQLGLNRTDVAQRRLPAALPTAPLGGRAVVRVAAGNLHSMVLTNDSAVYAFGANDHAQLGTANLTSYYYPTPIRQDLFGVYRKCDVYRDVVVCVQRPLATVVKMSLGSNFSLFLTDTHDVYVVGANYLGMLGVNSTRDAISLTQVTDSFNNGVIQDVAAGHEHSLLIIQSEDFDPGRTKMACFPTVAGLQTNCVVELFNERGYPYGGPEQLPNFRVTEVRGGDGRPICPPPADAPQYLDRGRYVYHWTSPALGRGGRFRVAFLGQPLLVPNTTHNARFEAMNHYHGYNPMTPLKTPEYLDAVYMRRPQPQDDGLYLFFKPPDAYDSIAPANFVANPSAEANPPGLAGWTVAVGLATAATSGPPPIAGYDKYYFVCATDFCRLQQTLNLSAIIPPSLIDGGRQLVEFLAHAQSVDEVPPDTARAVVAFLDATQTVTLDQYDSGAVSNLFVWQALSDVRFVRPGTRFVRITLEAANAGAPGSGNRAFFDQIVFRPATVKAAAQAQYAALADLYVQLGGPQWVTATNWMQGDPCSNVWAGVRCQYHNVVELLLANNNLAGSLPASIGNFPFLTRLDLSGNRLSGPVPDTLTQLAALRRLDVEDNALTELPASLATLSCLRYLHAARNNISEVPATVGAMFRLEALDLSENALSRQLPDLPGMAALQALALQRNQLPGSLPDGIGFGLPALRTLDVSHNRLNATVPGSLGNLSALYYLGLHHNQLFGEIPPELGLLPNLRALTLELHHNSLSGTVPAFVGLMGPVYLAANNFSCPIPYGFANVYDAPDLDCHEWPDLPPVADTYFYAETVVTGTAFPLPHQPAS